MIRVNIEFLIKSKYVGTWIKASVTELCQVSIKSSDGYFVYQQLKMDVKQMGEGRQQMKKRKHILTRSSWLNCALRDDEAVYWVSIGHYGVVAVDN